MSTMQCDHVEDDSRVACLAGVTTVDAAVKMVVQQWGKMVPWVTYLYRCEAHARPTSVPLPDTEDGDATARDAALEQVGEAAKGEWRAMLPRWLDRSLA